MNIITTEQKIKAMNDSVALIQKISAINNLTADQKRRIEINVKHLELMLSLDEIKNHSGDKSSFVNAIINGKQKIA